ncbi:MAG: AAA family ATPase [Leptospiraceae bacterium]|nr:AAA family ATPase [Leptospiraceae bacterium]
MKVISFYNAKGGTGKTSLCYLSALALANNQNKVLILDLDSQCSLSSAFNLEYSIGIYELLSDSKKIEECILPISKNLSIIPGSLKVLKIQNNVIQSKLTKELNKLKGYDYILIDNPPTFNGLVVASIFASDKVIIPTLLSKFDLESALFTMSEIDEIKTVSKCAVLNRVGKNTTKEENEYMEAFGNCKTIRFMNNISVRKLIDRNEDIGLKRHSKISEALGSLLDFIKGN